MERANIMHKSYHKIKGMSNILHLILHLIAHLMCTLCAPYYLRNSFKIQYFALV